MLSPGSAFRIASVYALFGAAWVAVSDRILEAFIADAHRITLLQSLKGWAFVALSSLLIFAVVRRELAARGRAESALAASEERYRNFVELANDAILVYDAQTGRIIDANRRAGELLGIPPGKLLGLHHLDLHPEAEHELYRNLFAEAVRTGKTPDGVVHFPRADGRRIATEVSLSLIEVGGRKVLMSILRDISERLEAERQLRLEKERAQLYLDVAGVMLVVLDTDWRIRLINRKGARMLGYAEAELVGKNWLETVVAERERAAVTAIFARLREGGGSPLDYHESPVLTREGKEVLVGWHNAVVRDDAGKAIGLISSGEDVTERVRAQAEARTRLERLATLHEIDLVISSSLDLRVTLAELLERVTQQFGLDAADVLLLHRPTQTLEYAAGRGFRTPLIKDTRLKLGEGIAGLAALERRGVRVPDLRDPAAGFRRTRLIEEEGFVAYYAVPLTAKGRVQGVLEALHRAPLRLDEEQQAFLESLASQAAIAIDNAALFEELQRSHSALTLAYDATLEGWARALDLRDQVTERHTERVTEMTVRLARAMGVGEEELAHVRRGAVLHDIGKIAIPDGILRKPGPLTPEEWAVMRRHPQLAFEMLQPIAYLRPALDIPYCHHEHWDGSGYPRGLRGEQIPLAARIFALADVWDALRASDRPYRTALSQDETCAEIRALAGTHLDPAVVETFLRLEGEPCHAPQPAA